MTAPKKTIATRILVSFAVTLVAFAVTVGFGISAQEKAARDSDELANGYVPVALRLGELIAVQTTISNLVEKSPGEHDPSTRFVLEQLVKSRRASFAETRLAMTGELFQRGSGETRELALLLAGGLDGAESAVGGDKVILEQLFLALERADMDAVNHALLDGSPIEIDCTKRLRALSDRLALAMDRFGQEAKARERRAIWQLGGLAALTLGLGVGVSLHTRRILAPLQQVTDRAQAVARGDLTPRAAVPSDDEIGQLSVAFEQMVDAVAREQSRAVGSERLAAIGKMAAHVTHEIRNPLSSIGLNIELLDEELAKGGVKGESKALLGAITREVQRLEHLSEEYLRVARLPEPRMEADDLAVLVRDVVSFVAPEMARHGCAVETTVEEPLPPTCFDESQIRQALLNLLRNAREAMADGGTVDVSLRGEGMSVVARVEDRGGGIPDAIRARVFDPFFSTKGEGTGLGLAITRQIVEAHGGTLSCEARAGGGTTFLVSLPISARVPDGRPARPCDRRAG